MDRRKYLRAYVRTDKRGKIVPGSLALLKKQPRTPGFKEVTNPGVNACACTTSCTGGEFVSISTIQGPETFAWPVYMNIDNQCNTYMLYYWDPGELPTPPGDNSEGAYSVIKRDPSGTEIWTKQLFTLSTAEMNSIFDGVYLLIDNNSGKLFVCGVKGVVAMDLDGNVLWAKQINLATFNAAGFGFNAFTNWGMSPDGSYLYAGGNYLRASEEPYYLNAFVCKMSTTNGDIVKDIAYFTPPISINDFYYDTVYGLKVDKQGNVIGEESGNAFGSAPVRSSHVFKWDADLNELWKTRMSPAETPGNYTDDLSVDVFGNPLVFFEAVQTPGYNVRSMVKIDGATGQLLWRALLEDAAVPGSYLYFEDKRSDAEGNLYIGSGYYAPPTYLNGTFEVLKVDPNGVSREFQYSIVPPTDYNSLTYYWYYTPTEGPNLDVGYYLRPLGSRSFDSSDEVSGELKLPLTPVSGTYGGWTFTDSLANYTWTSAPMPDFGPPDDITFTTVNRLNAHFVPLVAYTADITNPFTITLL